MTCINSHGQYTGIYSIRYVMCYFHMFIIITRINMYSAQKYSKIFRIYNCIKLISQYKHLDILNVLINTFFIFNTYVIL